MHGALGEPEVVPVQAKAIVQLAFVKLSAAWAAMLRRPGVVVEQRAVPFAATTGAREQRLPFRNSHLPVDEGLQLEAEPLRELRKGATSDGAPCEEIVTGGEKAHPPAPRGSSDQSCRVTSSPRMSRRAPRRRRVTP